MSEAAADKPPLPLDEVAAAGLALAAEPDLAGMGRRLRERLESWAAPSLVLCIERDAGADGGWRTVPELSSGTPSAGVERTLARMIEEAPAGTLARPTLLRTEVTAANVRPRDNVIVPWSWSGASGYLVLRGVPRPAPANLAEAVALVCLPVWPLLHAAPAAVAGAACGSRRGRREPAGARSAEQEARGAAEGPRRRGRRARSRGERGGGAARPRGGAGAPDRARRSGAPRAGREPRGGRAQRRRPARQAPRRSWRARAASRPARSARRWKGSATRRARSAAR